MSSSKCLARADDLADPQADLVLAGQAPFLARRSLAAGPCAARPLGGQQRIAAHRLADLDQVGSNSTFAPSPIPPTRGWRTSAVQFKPAGFTSSRMRASVSMPRSPTSTTRCSPKRWRLVDLRAHGHRIGGVAVKHLHGHRTARLIAQQAELDLQLAALAVAGMAALGQRTAAAFPRRDMARLNRAIAVFLGLD